MIIGGLQKSSLIDYPGKVSAIVFTRGCPLRCHFCHNPGLVLPEMFGKATPDWEVLEFLKSRVGRLDAVVVTGGEPTIHKDLPDFLATIKGMGYLVKLDTSGVNPEMVKVLLGNGLVDYIAMDIKAPLSRYSEVAGVKVNTEAIKRSVEIIRESGVDYEFRTTVVKGQLSKDDIVLIAKYIEGAKRYFLQRFRGGVTLDPGFAKRGAYSDAEFESIRDESAKHVIECEVR
ncbi:MAG: anaerobic ribonucleoside-triphosphate reductase activating protein [Candidatus Micrarchaeota archaeon]|nr:anaerobic ribonucleoside-triphosphate reductase activating protein [Candidatus Micrarchaeota archaeon]